MKFENMRLKVIVWKGLFMYFYQYRLSYFYILETDLFYKLCNVNLRDYLWKIGKTLQKIQNL